MTSKKDTIFSGMQPTGALHLGNYLGALKQWVNLQDEHPSIFCIVDYHSLTINYDPKDLPKRITNLAIDYLAAGLDPEKSIIFVQSHVPQHTELAWIFNTITPLGELERMTQFKDKAGQNKHNINTGLFTYPILQAADVLLYKANLVPVGEDQVQHVELMRDIARKFNKTFAKIFPEPKVLLTKTARIMSLADPKNKMSKSKGEKHYIALNDPAKDIRKKVKSAVTDADGVKNLLGILEALGKEEIFNNLSRLNQKGKLQYSMLKDEISNAIIEHLEPIQEKRKELEKNHDKIAEILIDGSKKAGEIAKTTMEEVREKIGIR